MRYGGYFGGNNMTIGKRLVAKLKARLALIEYERTVLHFDRQVLRDKQSTAKRDAKAASMNAAGGDK